MNRKIIFFDIDGTIYTPEIGITEKTKEAIALLRQNGHLSFIATGRPLSMLNEEILNLGFDGINAACGTYIICNNNIMLNKQLPLQIINDTIKLSERYNLDTIFEGEKGLFIDKNKINNTFLFLADKYKVFDWNTHRITANKLCIKILDTNISNQIITKLNEYYTVISRENNFLELVPKNYSKATGIKYIIEYLNIDWENTYAFGDSENDEDMMKYVNHSIAMGNSVDMIKKISKYITDTVQNDGVYNGLKKLEFF